LFAWWQDGKRTLITGGTGAQNGIGGTAGTAAGYDRTRSGLGMTFRKSQYRATAEYIKADGYYVDFGYLVLSNLELDVRYDTLNRRTDVAANERKFTTTTLGAQYFFNKKTRAALNFIEFRDAQAPSLQASNVANQVLNATDNRVSVQITMIF